MLMLNNWLFTETLDELVAEAEAEENAAPEEEARDLQGERAWGKHNFYIHALCLKFIERKEGEGSERVTVVARWTTGRASEPAPEHNLNKNSFH